MLEKSIHSSWTKDISSVKKPLLISKNSNTMCILKSLFVDIMPIHGTSWTCIGSVPFCKLHYVLNLKNDQLFTTIIEAIKVDISKFTLSIKEVSQPVENIKKIWKAGNDKLAILCINDAFYYIHIRFPCVDLYDTITQKGNTVVLKPSNLCNLLRLGKADWYKGIADLSIDIQDTGNGTIENMLLWDKLYVGIYERKAWRVGSFR